VTVILTMTYSPCAAFWISGNSWSATASTRSTPVMTKEKLPSRTSVAASGSGVDDAVASAGPG